MEEGGEVGFAVAPATMNIQERASVGFQNNAN